MPFIKCSQIWGGNHASDTNVSTGVLTASLYSTASNGGKGGDVYYFSVCARGILTRMVLADVVGHGKVVSDASRWLYDSLALKINHSDNKYVLKDLNMRLKKHHYHATSTITAITFHKEKSKLFFSYAGRPPLFIKRRNNKNWEQIWIQKSSPKVNTRLGVHEDAFIDEGSMPLNTGDILFLYTDGVLEAQGSGKQRFGTERVFGSLETSKSDHPNDLKNKVRDDLLNFSGRDFTHDDVTLMAIKIS